MLTIVLLQIEHWTRQLISPPKNTLPRSSRVLPRSKLYNCWEKESKGNWFRFLLILPTVLCFFLFVCHLLADPLPLDPLSRRIGAYTPPDATGSWPAEPEASPGFSLPFFVSSRAGVSMQAKRASGPHATSTLRLRRQTYHCQHVLWNRRKQTTAVLNPFASCAIHDN